MDNALLFLPQQAVVELGLEPNMDDKGDARKELWCGRTWELRSLLAVPHRQKIAQLSHHQAELTASEARELDRRLQEPELRARLIRIQAHWRGAACRLRSTFSVLERLKFCQLRGVLVYAHGSGGCNWDNFRICRMISRMGFLVVAPDGFAYPKGEAAGRVRHRDLAPLKRAGDDTDYWAGDLVYTSKASGSHNYSTSAGSVLEDPETFRKLYESCYQLRAAELHVAIHGLPQWIKSRGFFLGGTSEGGMTVCRFDDQRYCKMVIGRFIASFSMEYNYFTPTLEASRLGGQLSVPTLNIIGTKDQYFSGTDSVAKIVATDSGGYGDAGLVGHGFDTMVKQGVEVGLVCLLEDGVHTPCDTHDNFLRTLFDMFFARPGSIWDLDSFLAVDDATRGAVKVEQSSIKPASRVVQLFVPRSPYPNKYSLREVDAHRKRNWRFQQQLGHADDHLQKLHLMVAAKLEQYRQERAKAMGEGLGETVA